MIPSRTSRNTSTTKSITAMNTQKVSMPPAAFDLLENSLYRDFSHVRPSKNYIPRSPTSKEATFPEKLHFILSDSTYEDCVCWLPHGRGWKLLKPLDFEERILKLFFNHSNLSSFKRQVNGWCFKRMNYGIDEGAYYHEVSSISTSTLGKNDESVPTSWW